ncbi:MAG: zf-TFIIB domain-containing protein [Chloroflexota bacterium]
MTMTYAPAGAAAPLRCPRCAGEMELEPRAGITIDRCAGCRGLFLDRGELERLIESAMVGAAGSAASAQLDRRSPWDRRPERSSLDRPSSWDGDDDDDGWGAGGRSRSGAAPRKRGGFFRDLFEGFGD